MTIFLKQSTASQEVPLGYFLDSTNGDTEETALTINNTDIKLWKNGASTLANKNSGGATHISNGIYYATLDATDTNTVGPMVIFCHVSGALSIRLECHVLEEAIYDALYGASAAGFDANQRVDVGSWLGTAVTTSATTNKPEVDVNSISDDATAANNAELFYDGTGYDAANSTVGTVTTNTDMRGTDNAALASVVGALTDAAAAGDPTTADTVMQYVKQLINILVGTTGVTTYPAEAAPANNVSLSEVIRAIHTDVTGLNGDAMRGTDSAALAADYTSARAGYLDNINGHTAQTGDNFARLGAPAGASVSADIAGIQSDTDDIQTRLPAALTTGTADSGTTTTMVDAALTEADTDYWAGSWIRFTSGTISGQTRLITGFTPASDTVTFAPATTQAVATNTYEIIPAGGVDVQEWLSATPNALVAGAVDADVSAMQAGAVTAAAIATDAVDADALAADAATEIRDAVTGGAYALDTDANGRVRIVDGTGAGELDTDSGTVLLRAATETQIDNIETDTNSLNDTKVPDTISLANINAQVVDVMKTDTISEMAQQAPPATPTFEEAVMYLYMALRNKIDVTSSLKEFHNDAGTVVWKKSLTDDGTTYSEAEGATGP